MKKQQNTRALSARTQGLAVLASAMMAEPSFVKSKVRANETQKVFLLASLSLIVLLACTIIDVCFFR